MKVILSKELKKNQVAVHVYGEKACFSTPWSGYNCFTYPVITGSAARGIFDNIYAHPHNKFDASGNENYSQNFKWVIDKIFILNPLNYESFGINGIKMDKATEALPQQHTILTDVSYVIVGHPFIYDQKDKNDFMKYISIFLRRCKNHKAFYQPHLGFMKYPARYDIAPKVFDTIDLNMTIAGYLKDMVYDDSKGIAKGSPIPIFMPTVEIKNGVVILN